MKIDEVHECFYQNWARAMRELGFSKNTYQLWLKKGYIPIHTQLRIEEITGGKLMADVNNEEREKDRKRA